MGNFNLEDFEVVKAETLSTPNSITVYGPPGKGKSVFGASISEVPGFERCLIIDTEGSSVAVGPWYPNVDVVKAPTAEIFTKICDAVLNGEFVEKESGLPYQCVIIDTLDKAQERQLDLFALSPKRFNKQGEENVYFKWQAIKTWTSKLADAFHQAEFLTIFILHEDRDKDEATQKVTTTVMLGGKSQQIFPSVSDMVAYFNLILVEGDNKTKTLERAADFRPSDKLVAKQRFAGKLDGIILDPTFEKVFRKIEPQRFENTPTK